MGTAFTDNPGDEDLDWQHPVVWLSLAWVVGSYFSVDDDSIWGSQAASGTKQQQLPEGHPPVPRGARDLCAAALNAVQQPSAWLPKPSFLKVGLATVVITVLVVARRYRIERARERQRAELRRQRAEQCAASGGEDARQPARPPSDLDAWLTQHTRPASKPRPQVPPVEPGGGALFDGH